MHSDLESTRKELEKEELDVSYLLECSLFTTEGNMLISIFICLLSKCHAYPTPVYGIVTRYHRSLESYGWRPWHVSLL